MDLPPDDPLAGFFRGEGLKKVTLKTGRGPDVSSGRRDERVGDDPAAVRCPVVGEDDSDEDEPFANGAGGGGNEYWRDIRAREDRRARAGANTTHGSANVVGASTVMGSRMTGLEADTVPGSSVGQCSEVPPGKPENLREKYNFARQRAGYSGNKQLAVMAMRQEVVDAIDQNQVTVISGHTGCGKTTQVPQFVLDDHAQRNKYVNIVVTQPRRIAAQSVARRVARERDWELGRLVGYKIGHDRNHTSKDTRLMYCTTGVLLNTLVAERNLFKWTHIFIDEVHERDQNMDFVLLLIKKLCCEIPTTTTKIVLMSATVETQRFCEYFASYQNGHRPAFHIPIAPDTVRTTNFDVPVIYGMDSSNKDTDLSQFYPAPVDYTHGGPKLYTENVEVCRTIVERLDNLERRDSSRTKEERGAVLVFLPGEQEIMTVKRSLQERCGPDGVKNGLQWTILVLHSRIPLESMDHVFESPLPGHRKIILATNMAESSITIPDVEYVIDFCLTKVLRADPATNYVALRLDWADKSSCEQRKGRAGRVSKGRVYRLICKEYYTLYLVEHHDPEMKRSPLAKVVLKTKELDFGAPKELLALAMDPPDLINIKLTTFELKEVGALLTTVNGVNCKDDGDLTTLGELISKLPIDVRLGKLVVLGHLLDVLEEAVIVAAGLSGKSIFSVPFEDKVNAYANKLTWAKRSFSDCLAILNAYNDWSKAHREGKFLRSRQPMYNRNLERDWCVSRYLQVRGLKDMQVAIADLKLNLKEVGIVEPPRANVDEMSMSRKWQLLQYAMFGAFYPNYFLRARGNQDLREQHKTVLGMDPSNTVYFHGFPQGHSKFGALYAREVKQFFSRGQVLKDHEHIDVKFENYKVLVSFAKTSTEFRDEGFEERDADAIANGPNVTGEILTQVYTAMKLPKHKMQLLVCASEAQAKEEHDRYVAKRREVALHGLTGGLVLFEEVGRIKEPSMNVSKVKIEVSHVDSPNSFWAQYDEEEYHDALQKVETEIKGAVKTAQTQNLFVKNISELRIGCLYLAPYKDPEDVDTFYFRVRLEKIYGDKVGCNVSAKVFFIDYGNTETVKGDQLVPVDARLKATYKKLASAPAAAIECSLAEVRPNPARNTRGIWDSEVVGIFKAMVLRQKLVAEVYSVVPQADSPLIAVKLQHDKFQTIDDWLKRNPAGNQEPKYAAHSEEKYQSKYNREARMRPSGFPEDFLEKPYLVGQDQFEFKGDPCCPRILTEPLRGPLNPLEFRLTCAHRMGAEREVRVEPDSVNHVLLDRYPSDPHDQWLVAGHVSLTPHGGSSISNSLLLRNTTFMPNHPGLGALLTAVFAPFVEMRCDSELKRYTGLLAGLGWRETDWGLSARQGSGRRDVGRCSYSSMHDLEVKFDVQVDDEDLATIRKLRYYINKGLWREPLRRADGKPYPADVQRREVKLDIVNDFHKLYEYRGKIKHYFDALMNRDRPRVDKLGPRDEHNWCALATKHVKKIKRIEDDASFFLKTVDGIRLRSS